ncbi:G protein-activated inward rectifier potassium channel 3-like [Tachypleus tridentatus]|uniref:G protein-activated inward rectifier potassium channel 3-like n=1 Tax=Tachypleus tridentatus TaxID=6853 RepID=UPI003FD3CF87
MNRATVWQELIPSQKLSNYDIHMGMPLSASESEQPNREKTLAKHLFEESTFQCNNKYKQNRVLPSRHRKRLILKNGTVNSSVQHIAKRSQRYLQDIFITLVDIQWRWNLLVFAMGFILTWLGFGVVWWLINYAHGDFEHIGEDGWEPCVHNIKSFTSAFLFSLETQHTIGYGSRMINEECPEAIFIMCIQSITGVMIQSFIVGMVFAKFSRPKKRQQTLMFSRNAIVSVRDGKMCLMFRVGDLRKSLIIGAHISAQLVRKKITAEGEVIPYFYSWIDIKCDQTNDNLLLIWPTICTHEINEASPFYSMGAEDMMKDKFEIIVILEGTIESTGQSFQARSSYLPNEILWGHRFEQLVSYSKETGDYVVDYGKFNNTFEVETPLCSAKEYIDYQNVYSQCGASPQFSRTSSSLAKISWSQMESDYSHH